MIWFNDLEKDKRYKYWPKSITEVLTPKRQGALYNIRRNLYNALFVLDFTLLAHLRYLDDLFVYIQREIPLRIGIIPFYDDSRSIECIFYFT